MEGNASAPGSSRSLFTCLQVASSTRCDGRKQTATLSFIDLAVHNANPDIHCTDERDMHVVLDSVYDLTQSMDLTGNLILLVHMVHIPEGKNKRCRRV